MDIPSLQERKEFWSWGYANCAFEQVVEGCNFLSSSSTPIPNPVRKLLVAGIVATYARPFTASHGAHTIPNSVIPKEHLRLHQELMDLRHKQIAHVDAQNYLPDDKSFGNINQVRISVTKGRNTLFAFSVDAPVKEIKELATILLDRACPKGQGVRKDAVFPAFRQLMRTCLAARRPKSMIIITDAGHLLSARRLVVGGGVCGRTR